MGTSWQRVRRISMQFDNVVRGSTDLMTRRIPMQLYTVRGSFFAADDTDGAAAPAMDAEVWSRLPEELVWEVLRFVPAAKQFQLQLVSRKWCEVLTSANFRSGVAASAAAAAREQQHQQRHGVVACVGLGKPEARRWQGCKDKTVVDMAQVKLKGKAKVANMDLVKVVDMDLSSFVPDSFWQSNTYSVVAAGDGLVCISNDADDGQLKQYCVLNPLTRTCRVLPQVPFQPVRWLPPTSTALTIFGYTRRDGEVLVATYDLTRGGGRWDVVAAYTHGDTLAAAAHTPGRDRDEQTWTDPLVAQCAGETYLYYDRRVHVLAPRSWPGSGIRKLEEAGVLEQPSVELLGVDPSQYRGHGGVKLVAHRGAVFLVKGLVTNRGVGVLVGVWRLARQGSRLQWEAVARLLAEDVKQLKGLHCIEYDLLDSMRHTCCYVFQSFGVREFLCCNCMMGRMRFMVGFNLDSSLWELVHNRHMDSECVSGPFELRPDLFL